MTGALAMVAALVGVTVWLAMPGPPRPLRRRRHPGRRASAVVVRTAWGVLALVAGLVLAFVGGTAGRLLVAASVVGVTVAWAVRSHRSRSAIDRARLEVSEVCQVLSSQLQAGQVPGRALLVAADDCHLLDLAASSLRVGADVPAALREAATRPGCEGLATLAGAWQVAERAGAPVADLVARVAEEQRDDQKLRAVVAGELAAPRATGKLLACLPLVGVGMAAMVGARPLHFLLMTGPGAWCVLAAAVFTCIGVVWTEHIADGGSRAQRRGSRLSDSGPVESRAARQMPSGSGAEVPT